MESSRSSTVCYNVLVTGKRDKARDRWFSNQNLMKFTLMQQRVALGITSSWITTQFLPDPNCLKAPFIYFISLHKRLVYRSEFRHCQDSQHSQNVMWFSSNRNDFLLSKQNTAANVNLDFLFVMVVPFDLCVICQLPGSAQCQETHLFHSPHGNFKRLTKWLQSQN